MSDFERASSDSHSDRADGSVHGDQSDTGRRYGPPDPSPTRDEGPNNNDVEPDGQPGEVDLEAEVEVLPLPPTQAPALRDRQATTGAQRGALCCFASGSAFQ